MTTISPEIKKLLEQEATRIDSHAFIANDPVQFPRRFSDLKDIEITSLLISNIAWGNRKMICRNAEKLLDIMRHEPYAYTMSADYENLDPQRNIHRTFFCRHLIAYLRGLRQIYTRHTSIDAFAAHNHIQHSQFPPWTLAQAINSQITQANGNTPCPRCLPLNLDTSALKRLNMALRWLVRDDGIVDLGVWKTLTPAQLFIPLDIHAGRTARTLGLLQRKANDRKATVELTQTLRTIRPHDPVWFDFALFGLGIEGFTDTH